MVQLQCDKLIPRPNQLRVKESFTEQDKVRKATSSETLKKTMMLACPVKIGDFWR